LYARGALNVLGLLTGANVRVTGNLEVQGTTTTVDSQTIVSSNLVITNAGTGPALTVTQTGANDIASFYDDSAVAMKIWDGGNITIGTGLVHTEKLTVSGNVSATGLTLTGGLNGTTGTFSDAVTSLGNVGVGTAVTNSKLTIYSNTQGGLNGITLTGQEYLSAATTSTSGFGLVLGTNRTGNRQLWMMDTAFSAPSATNGMIAINPRNGTGSAASWIGAMKTNNSNDAELLITESAIRLCLSNYTGSTAVTIAGNLTATANITANSLNVSTPITQSYTTFSQSAFQYETTASQNAANGVTMYFAGPQKGGTVFLVHVLGANGSAGVVGILDKTAYVPAPFFIISGIGNYVQSCTWTGSQIAFTTRSLPDGGGGGWVSCVKYIPLS
jgi:hypothetical protein